MIPKIIHYCWFGGKPKPKSVQRCIGSWRKFCPDYEIKEWNEENFDVNAIPYTRDAYQAGKYAFVSDVARFWVLYEEGGVYFDTDVEIIRPIDDLVERGAFMGWEKPDVLGNMHVAPGLGLAAPKDFPLYKEILDGFSTLSYYLEGGQWNPYTMIPLVTDLLKQKGLCIDGTYQNVNVNDNANSGDCKKINVPVDIEKKVDVPVDVNVITIYPAEYLCPMDSLTGKIELTDNTYTIHHYTMSWLPKSSQWRVRMMRMVRALLKRERQ